MDLDAFLPAILSGDARAFGQWMARAEGPLRDSLRSFVTAVDVESVLQEALLRVWQVAPRFVADGRPNGLLRLALRIARNLAMSEVRRMRARPVPDEDLEHALAAAAEGGPAAPDPLLREVLARCHERLPDKPRQALDARLGAEGGTNDDVVAQAARGVPRARGCRARRGARRMTQPSGIGPEDEELLVEQVASAYRPRSRDELRYHPAWHDLGDAGRVRAHEVARASRKVEAALDVDGLSTTARAVLARIEVRRGPVP